MYLESHLVEHVGKVVYKCNECDVGCKDFKDLRDHLAKEHSYKFDDE